ncbi:MAG: outer membrane protein assembly factor BamD [Sulfuricurvum sp.]|nr:outer membrane protein assembly factor BamD [Sulfuricurvum sp.]
MIIRIVIMAAMTVLFLTGCGKDIEEYNKPADYWYAKMITSVSDGNLEKADGYFSSLQSEHVASPLLSEATLIMAQAHMAYEEYLLAEHFLDEYNRRYATSAGKEYAEFLKIKSKFLALPNPGRDQGLIDETLKGAIAFKANYPYSIYTPLITTMETQLQLAKSTLNGQIAGLYDRLGKPKGAVAYRNNAPVTWIDPSEVQAAQVPWYREMFEGDGSSSWYAFMIPKTRSVISMDDNDTFVPVVTPYEKSPIDNNNTLLETSKVTSWYDFLIPSF